MSDYPMLISNKLHSFRNFNKLIFACIILRCCYIIMFRIRDAQLRNTLAALLCGLFGLFLNGYVGRGMGFQPGVSLIGFFFAFILNGPLIEQRLSKKTN